MESKFHNTELKTESLADALNSASPTDAARELGYCLDVPRWIAAVADARPFPDDGAVMRCVLGAAAPFTDEEIHGALRSHPRIGERPDGRDEHAEHARREQSDVDLDSGDVRNRLREANIEYESRFGHIFLIRAAGRSGADVLAAVRDRLRNDRATERGIVEHELRDIAALRLTIAMSRG